MALPYKLGDRVFMFDPLSQRFTEPVLCDYLYPKFGTEYHWLSTVNGVDGNRVMSLPENIYTEAELALLQAIGDPI